MTQPNLRLLGPAAALLLTSPLTLAFQDAAPAEVEAPIAKMLEELGEEIRVYDEHVTFLSNPFFGGRLPGTPVMKFISDYVEHYLIEAGLEPGFFDESGEPTFRQPFPLGQTITVNRQELSIVPTLGDPMPLRPGREFIVTGYGISGEMTAPVVFAGYSVRRGPDDYESYPEDIDLTGKIALILRFEPMDEDGKSLWASGRSPWSKHQILSKKVRNALRHDAAAVIVVNAPGADDPRAEELKNSERRKGEEIPVLFMSSEAGDKLVRSLDAQGRSLMDLRQWADGQGGCIELTGGELALGAGVDRSPTLGYNIGGMLPGKGELADEYIVMGGHIDHLGIGEFGSRDRDARGQVHPGADDNASGTAGILMLAERLRKHYDALPEGAPARSILFVGFSGEESGLNGSNYYVKNPVVPLEKTVLMCNFDMIGRISNRRVTIEGGDSAEGMSEWLAPIFEATPLEVVTDPLRAGGSDHLPFKGKGVPYLFAICADFHDDYHTPRDESWKINRVDSLHALDVFEEILKTAGTSPEAFIRP